MKKKLDLNELIWFLILIAFTYYFYMNLSTGKITLFVHPKMVKYVKFSVVFFVILAIFQIKNIFSDKKPKSFKLGCFMFLIPIALGIFVRTEEISATTVINKGFSLTSQLKINNLKHKHTTLTDGTEQCEHDEKHNHGDYESNTPQNNVLKSSQLSKGETVIMTNEDFISNYEDIYGNSCKYVDRAINMKGFIYKQKGLMEEEFILSRILVSCCMADVQIVGLLCDYKGEVVLNEGEFISIEGILGEREYKDTKSGESVIIPVIKVNRLEKIDKLSNEYIYNH
ncbi:TIGR03943 family protein [Clostridium sp. CS001]|uniref:TIGR03943 family putative permease subunit n=1 Tax=Clostridium sp. CS001 TaxID=2880648 RepID=UPI001CF2A649|nr:TIGR03943 family protein [Clostridium sp. CS001]MCB2290711.1 TIGR03943 family protein [Clostridium sp. CS001]